MKRASITEAKNRLSALLDRVRHGETILIEDRGVAVAQIGPVSRDQAGLDRDRLARLERAGLVQAGRLSASELTAGRSAARAGATGRVEPARRRGTRRGLVKFWDTSALVPLLVEEPATAAAQAAYRADPVVIVAWTTPIECASAIARAAHDGALDDRHASAAFARLDELMRVSREVEPSRFLQDTARRLLRVHRLRAADAVQLASAILAAQHQPGSLPFLTRDERLARAARREGFDVA